MWRLPALLALSLCGPVLTDDSAVSREGPRRLEDGHQLGEGRTSAKVIPLATVACEQEVYVEEVITAVKIAMLFSRTPIHLHVFLDHHLRELFVTEIHKLVESGRNLSVPVTFTIHDTNYPGIPEDQSQTWRKMFGPCASLKLFVPSLLPDEDFVIFVDSDVLFLRRADDLLGLAGNFNLSQIAGVAPEHEGRSISWYSRFSRVPHVPPHGVNSGVILMNLTRMRAVGWQAQILQHYKTYGQDARNLTWHDQDLVNILFHFHPEKLYQFPCNWNYRSDHCKYMSNCRSAEKEGVNLLHGSRQAFHSQKQPMFKAVYDAIRQFRLGSDMEESLVRRMEKFFVEYPTPTAEGGCRNHPKLFTKHLMKEILALNTTFSNPRDEL